MEIVLLDPIVLLAVFAILVVINLLGGGNADWPIASSARLVRG